MDEPEEFECTVTAPVNIALVKYWGKKDQSLIIPYNDSISLTLDEAHLGTKTTVRFSTDFLDDSMILNGAETEMSNRVQNVIEELRRRARKVAIRKKLAATELMKLSRYRFQIVTENNMPTAAGLASSASGLASLTLAIAVALGIDREVELSAIARQGSGSACRSMHGGLVRWHSGTDESGVDSISEQVMAESAWPSLRVLVLIASDRKKSIGSTAGMQSSLQSSKIMLDRPQITRERIDEIVWAFKSRNFAALAEVTMKDSNQLHAICLDTFPPIHYLQEASFGLIDFVHAFNDCVGETKLAYTFDAGPNCFLLLEKADVPLVSRLLQICFLEDSTIRFGTTSNDADINLAKFEALIGRFQANKCSISYAIETKMGSGPKILSPVSPRES